MIEKTVKEYLEQYLDTPAYLEYPDGEEVPKKHIMVEKTGSGRYNRINSATIAIQSHGTSLWEAMSLNEAVKTAMDDIAQLNEVSSAKLNSDYNFTDTSKKRYRYQAVYDIVHY